MGKSNKQEKKSKKKHKHKERKEKKKKSKKMKKPERQKTKKIQEQRSKFDITLMQTNGSNEDKNEDFAIPVELMNSKSHAPETPEEYQQRQNRIRREIDPSTGRSRLIKGDGEVLEEIVSKDRHKAINKEATKGDGNFFQENTLVFGVESPKKLQRKLVIEETHLLKTKCTTILNSDNIPIFFNKNIRFNS